jgi:uncharacterized protein YcbK (DUF882 family)
MNNIKDPAFFLGVVEDRMDPMKLGRVRVRILGLHTHDKTQLPTEDLPWAYKIQPTTSGSISGIGHAPVGVMEGTWVVIQFIDPDKQMPFVVGALGGIPQSKIPPIETFELYNAENSVVPPATTEQPAQSQPIDQPQPTPVVDPAWKVKVIGRLGELESTNNYQAVNSLGYLGKYQFGAAALQDRGYVKRGTKNSDLANPESWTGKNGIRSREDFLASKQVQEDVMNSQVDANYKQLRRLGVPMDNLADAEKGGLVAAAHLYGPGGAKQLYNGVVKRDAYGTGTDKYYREGYKSVAGAYPKSIDIGSGAPAPTPQETALHNQRAIEGTTPAEEASNPSAYTSPLGYRIGLVSGSDRTVGFRDPNQKYPSSTLLNEPDTNRLARHEKVNETVVYSKEQTRHVGVEKANGKGAWTQSPIPYNALYPFNNVYQSESGHLLEFDDTKGCERIHLYHAKGTYTEVDHNGTQVNFIVGDSFVIMERNGHVHCVGNMDVNVEGAHTLKVSGTADIQINGATTINVHDSAKINVASTLDLTAGGDIKISSGGNITVDAAGYISTKAASHIAMDGSKIDLNTGTSVSTGLGKIDVIGGTVVNSPQLNVIIRGDVIASDYEIESDDPAVQAAYQERMINEGIMTKEELETTPDIKDETKPAESRAQIVSVECGIPANQKEFTGAEQLSKYYTLADLTMNYTRKLKAVGSVTEAQIFCNLKALAINVLDPLREKYPNMKINSGYRNFVPAGGSTTSQHLTGQAVDVSFPDLSRSELYNRCIEAQQLVPYDQLILEYANGPGWLHFSFKMTGNRKQQFTMNHHKRVSKDVYTISRVY